MTTVRAVDYSHEKAVLALGFSSRPSAMLLAATQHGSIHAHDLRMRGEAWSVEAPPQRGLPVCMCVGSDGNWLALGTSRGYVLVYDVRFQLHVHWWRHPCKGQIFSVSECSAGAFASHQAASSRVAPGPAIVTASDRNQVSIWDVGTGSCVLHLSATSRGYASDMSNISCKMGAEGQEPETDLGLREWDSLSLSEEAARAVHVAPDCSHVISAGSDRKIRVWDVAQPTRSSIIGGPPLADEAYLYAAERVQGPSSTVHHVYEQRIPSPAQAAGVAAYPGLHLGGGEGREAMGARGCLPPPSDEHLDAVTQLAVLRSPWGHRLLSASSDGIVKVWS